MPGKVLFFLLQGNKIVGLFKVMKILQQIICDSLSKWRETTPFYINLEIMD